MTLQSRDTAPQMRSATAAKAVQSGTSVQGFSSHCPEEGKIALTDVHAFRRRQGDLLFSLLMFGIVVFFALAFVRYTGWQSRKLPDQMGLYILDQLGLAEVEGRRARFGKILKQGWVAPLAVMGVLVPAAALNLRAAVRSHRWRVRFRQPTGARFEVALWARALEYILWFVAYTMLVPVLGYLISTLLLGTLLPWRLGYRGARWFGICLGTSLIIVLIFRTGLQIRTPVNIWLYDQVPTALGGFMKTWF